MSSHTGAAALNQFPRYLADHDIQTIAATGGLIGLRPYNHPDAGSAPSTNSPATQNISPTSSESTTNAWAPT